jgi:hypothetical protein
MRSDHNSQHRGAAPVFGRRAVVVGWAAMGAGLSGASPNPGPCGTARDCAGIKSSGIRTTGGAAEVSRRADLDGGLRAPFLFSRRHRPHFAHPLVDQSQGHHDRGGHRLRGVHRRVGKQRAKGDSSCECRRAVAYSEPFGCTGKRLANLCAVAYHGSVAYPESDADHSSVACPKSNGDHSACRQSTDAACIHWQGFQGSVNNACRGALSSHLERNWLRQHDHHDAPGKPGATSGQ